MTSSMVVMKTLEDMSVDSGYVAGSGSGGGDSSCGSSKSLSRSSSRSTRLSHQSPLGSPRRGGPGWGPHSSATSGSLTSRNGSWDTVSSGGGAAPEDQDLLLLLKCPCLPELEDYPWTDAELRQVLLRGNVTGGAAGAAASFGWDAVHRLSMLLRRALVRISREAQRLSEMHRRCTRFEVCRIY